MAVHSFWLYMYTFSVRSHTMITEHKLILWMWKMDLVPKLKFGLKCVSVCVSVVHIYIHCNFNISLSPIPASYRHFCSFTLRFSIPLSSWKSSIWTGNWKVPCRVAEKMKEVCSYLVLFTNSISTPVEEGFDSLCYQCEWHFAWYWVALGERCRE